MDDPNVIQPSGNQDQAAQSLDKPGEVSFELSDGRKAVLRQGMGKDLLLAQRAAKEHRRGNLGPGRALAYDRGQARARGGFIRAQSGRQPEHLREVGSGFFVTPRELLHLAHVSKWGYVELMEMDMKELGFWCKEAVGYPRRYKLRE